MYRKLFVLFSMVIIVALLVLYHEPLLHWVQNNERDYVIVTTVIATLMSLFPVIPYPLVGGVVGAVYGPILGAFIIWMGSTFASMIFFAMIRYGGFDKFGNKILLRYTITKKITVLFERNAFMSITVLRMIPVIPSILINAYAALSRVPFLSYSIASGLGKIPAMTLFALVGHTIVTNPIEIVYMILIYGVFISIVYTAYRYWTKRINLQMESQTRKKQPSEI
ncbi:TVP38/TMEM64 family protein [Evansella cellulosilytica]|uniref:TVP38/TMEM64 family membrane protein n=1 Tax=Evansella cellulosilytica (strain ATCC 21833 / DSM 2522 / FERM P-1141 / JCM 9156 / N-4) TaxID=649639 RepID=E6U1P6_EVAC2|nr:VTT domain-containing protein [Evansella cellulosilytica]ADU30409.1 SNARE associated Golgi protein-related protein [Evansella cellulosilytica DSM 2522]